MIAATFSCDVCFGSDLQAYPAMTSCGRALWRCAGCGLVAASPSRAPDDPLQSPSREARDEERRAAAVRRLLPSGRVLDVGCGTGVFLAALEPELYVVTGLEQDDGSAILARERLQSVGARGSVLVGELRDSRLPSESFDLVALFGHLARSASPRATLMEVSRLLHPGGHVMIETPSLDSLTARLRGTHWRPLHDPRADYFFTPATLRRLVVSCGFEPGPTRPPMPAGWPHPGTLVHVARKAGQPVRLLEPADLAEAIPSISSPLGALQ
ncbi:MAG: class I SAM-dependent methyltransferase [Candidatus Polarisedimenticolia bacterium]